MKYIIIIFCISVAVALPSQAVSGKIDFKNYPGQWQTEPRLDIARALVKNEIRQCSEFRYKQHIKLKNEYLLQCTPNGKKWRSYILWLASEQIKDP